MKILATWFRSDLCALALGALLLGFASNPCWASMAELQGKYASLEAQLDQSPFRRPLVLVSNEAADRLTGDIYAVMDHPFAALSTQLSDPGHWCDVMILHINTKYCKAGVGTPANPAAIVVNVSVGKKTAEVLTDAMRIEFAFAVLTRTPDYFEVVLSAREGPLGTSDYRLRLRAITLPNSKTFLHLSYSYAANMLGRVAMQAYLGTAGRGKVGFTTTGTRPDGQPVYIDGMRALVERNAMRYYLAIDSYLKFTEGLPATQVEKRLQAWYAAVEQYPRQLHDVEWSDYLQMKRSEVLRQQAAK